MLRQKLADDVVGAWSGMRGRRSALWWMALLSVATLWGGLVACQSADTAGLEPTPVLPTLLETGDTGQAQVPDDLWLAIEGQVEVLGGQWGAGTLRSTLYKRGAPAPELSELCSTLTVFSSAPLAESSTVATELYGRWTVGLDGEGCLGVPERLELGIGPLDPLLWPAVERADRSIRHTRGLYAQLPGGLVIFGSAATVEQQEGRGTPASLVPLPNGTYLLDGIYLLPL